MSHRTQHYLRPLVALISAIVTALAIELVMITPSWQNIVSLLCADSVVAIVAVFVWHRSASTDSRALGDYLTRLSQIDAAEGDAHQLKLPVNNQSDLYGPLINVRDTMQKASQRVLRAENARASAEFRARSNEDRLARMREIMSNLDTPIVAIDHFDELVLANRSAEELLKLNLEESEDRSITRMMQCAELTEMLTKTRRRKSKSDRVSEIELIDQTGLPTHYKVACRSFEVGEQNENEHRGAVAVLSDISGEKAIQKRNAEFVSAVSHEMKTPLSGIKAYVELLADGDAEDEQTREEFLEVINGQADRLHRLIDNMLNLARIEAGVVDVSKEPQSLNEILEEAISIVEPSAEQKQIALKSELSSMYLGILADRDLFLQAAINLLSNAIKYTPPGGQVTIRSRLNGDQARFEVEDTGVGLNETDLKHVFDKFYRVKKDRNMASGTGLGLPLVKHIIEDVHGGQMIVSSIPGQGSKFGAEVLSVAKIQN